MSQAWMKLVPTEQLATLVEAVHLMLTEDGEFDENTSDAEMSLHNDLIDEHNSRPASPDPEAVSQDGGGDVECAND